MLRVAQRRQLSRMAICLIRLVTVLLIRKFSARLAVSERCRLHIPVPLSGDDLDYRSARSRFGHVHRVGPGRTRPAAPLPFPAPAADPRDS